MKRNNHSPGPNGTESDRPLQWEMVCGCEKCLARVTKKLPESFTSQPVYLVVLPSQEPEYPAVPDGQASWKQESLPVIPPTPYRPQLKGETFLDRLMKNMFLSAIEAIAGQIFLAIRQLILPPARKR